ncbi:interleukin-13 receptor subunit alpha-2-like isoform X1 [Polyodon spathula]|uniref:interleukin-13 receptor subunit alpha-2-like isoform X1 n=1 Tax=Polyodon spathula TaxID=7913 RepID=UPI001B7F605C|nr:interleukin-13 receptor subunit alpha-2-like isoform X1 [Polyodon spathula]
MLLWAVFAHCESNLKLICEKKKKRTHINKKQEKKKILATVVSVLIISVVYHFLNSFSLVTYRYSYPPITAPGGDIILKGVRCLIHDEDYTECTWKETGRPDHNYTFQSRYRTGAEYAECPSYTQVEGYNVGCRLEYSPNIRFATFQVQLSSANNTAIWNKDIHLKPLVKLYSPVNLTVVNSSSNGLYLYWNTSMSKSHCLESIVR